MIDLSTLEGFEWDSGNRDKNRVEHKVEWTEAEETFLGVPLILLPDLKHSGAETRLNALGQTLAGRKLSIVFTMRDNRIRVILARDMSKKERKQFDEAIEKNT